MYCHIKSKVNIKFNFQDVTKQKIIYQGKILKDNEILKDVFKQNKNEESTEEVSIMFKKNTNIFKVNGKYSS